MIRLAHRRLIIPRGDTGSFSVPALIDAIPGENMIAVFSIFTKNERIWTHEYPVEGGMVRINFEHNDTEQFPLGLYQWDIKIYVNPRYDDSGLLIDGDEVHSYYAGFQLPECEITLAPIYGEG